MSNFIFQNTTKVYFGQNQLENLGQELSKFGKRVLLCYGGGSIKESGLYDKIVKEIKTANLEIFELSGIKPNPRVSSVNEGAKICKEKNIDVLLAVGGGSVIDCTKYIGAAAFYEGDAWDISLGKVDVKECLPVVTVLTLAATGSEMNTGGVISNPKTNDKIGLLFEPMLPKVSFLDPTLTYSVNEYQTKCGAVDIMSHIMEVYFSKEKDLFMLDKVMESLLKTVIKFAPIAVENPNNYDARANLMWASSWALNGFLEGSKDANWIVHSIEHQLSAYYDITHGLGLAIVTPRWMRYILDETTVDRFYDFGVNVFDIDSKLEKMEVATQAINKLEEFFFKTLNLESKLSNLEITEKYFVDMSNKIYGLDSSVAFKKLSEEDVVNILKMSL